jgi:DNA-directed RNA polymerase subunit N (RpoN/RPB10)
VIACFVDLDEIDDHCCLEMIVRLVDLGGIDYHGFLEVIGCFVDLVGIDDHCCLEMIVRFVDLV